MNPKISQLLEDNYEVKADIIRYYFLKLVPYLLRV